MITKLLVIVMILSAVSVAQDMKKGVITHISTQNTYVNFGNTKGILIGDTLYYKKEETYNPVLKIEYLSSKSAAGHLIGGAKLQLNDELIAFIKPEQVPQILNKEKQLPQIQDKNEPEELKKRISLSNRKSLSGKFSISSYTGFNNYSSQHDIQRWRYTLSLNAENAGGSNLSFTNYMIFSYKTRDWTKVKSDLFYALKIYDLAVKYDISETDEIWLGRRLNRRLTNTGPADGLQYEKQFSPFYIGFITGFKPDYLDLSINSNSFQFGGFIGRVDSGLAGYMENSISFMQQTYNSKTDRRFLYFQHSNNLLSNTNLFFSSEVDLYKKEKGITENNIFLTSLYLSARYLPARWISLNLSYDARKNVVYYESFRSFIDSLIENETRQGIRFGIGVRPFTNVYLNINSGYRYRPGDLKPSRNIDCNLSYSSVPVIESALNTSFSFITGSYIEGSIWGINLYKDFSFNKTNLSVAYRKSFYKYLSQSFNSNQNNILVDISTRIIDKTFFSIGWDGTFEQKMTLGRLLLNISIRF